MLRAPTLVLLLDADTLHDARLMARLLDSPHAERPPLDCDLERDDKPVRLCVAGGQIAGFHKQSTAAYD